ncbi:MAG TPA: septation protein IspZ [Rhizomicrobium sp.]|jgi:intracellular septation protein A|nr:septation protein IspZ [Rhizomicrobium sp.]
MTNLAKALAPLLSDLASTLFFAALIAITGNVYLATGVGIGVGILQIVWEKFRGKPIALMQWMSLGLVVVFGTLTLYFHDARFAMIKFFIAHVAIGIAMIKPNWMSRYLPPIVTGTLSKSELTFYSAMWPLSMFAQAGAGLYVGLKMGIVAWATFLAVVPPAATWGLFALQYVLIRLHVRGKLRRGAAVAVPAE